MRVEFRRRMHENNMDFHYELILVPTKKESRTLDGFLDSNGNPDLLLFPFEIVGEITTDDNWNTYIRIILAPKNMEEKIFNILNPPI